MTHPVVEILLTRPVTHRELRRACRILPLGANCDRTRLMHPAKTPGLDALTTHYPSPSGQVILNVGPGRESADRPSRGRQGRAACRVRRPQRDEGLAPEKRPSLASIGSAG